MNGWLSFEKRWLHNLLHALVPAQPGCQAPGLQTLDLAPFWLMLSAAAPPLLRLGLRASAWLLTWLPLLTPGFFRPFFLLSTDDRDRYLMQALNSRLFLVRQLVQTLKIVSCFALFRDPIARQALGVQP